MVKQLNPKLTPEQKAVLLNRGTEAPFSGELLHNDKTGSYNCMNCGAELFDSTTKFDSGSGWPSFYDMAKPGAVTKKTDTSLGMERTEVICTNCGAHLGHLFDDAVGQPTGQRYCINSVCLKFNEKK